MSGAIVEQLVVLQNNFLKYSRFNAEVGCQRHESFEVEQLKYVCILKDVSLGLWLAPYNITRKHDTRFDSEWKVRCSQLIAKYLFPSLVVVAYYDGLLNKVSGMFGQIHCAAPIFRAGHASESNAFLIAYALMSAS